jgi:V/A-type H+-transporting ATPase subunit E
MGLEEVKQGLQHESDERAQALLDEAEERREAILADVEDELEAYRDEQERKAEKQIEKLRQSGLAGTKLAVKKRILAAKKDIIDDVMDEAKRKLVRKRKSTRESYITALLERAADEIDIHTVRCASKDEKLIDNYNVVVDDDIDGGIICENDDGSTSVDLTYDTILAEIRRDAMNELAEVLFE